MPTWCAIYSNLPGCDRRKGKIRNSKNMSLVFYMQLPRKVQFIWLLTLIGGVGIFAWLI